MAKVYKHISKAEHSVPAREVLGIDAATAISGDMLENIVLSGGLSKKMNTVIGSLIVEEDLWDDALSLSQSANKQVAFRVSWGLEWAYALMSNKLEQRSDRFVEVFLQARNESVNRVFSKMLCDMTRRGAVRLSDPDAERVAVKAFDLLIDPETDVAVKVWQIELLSDLMDRFEWIEENLTETVRTMSESPDCTPAMAAHARHYFRGLGKRKSKKQ